MVFSFCLLGHDRFDFQRLILIVVPKRLNRSEEALRAGTSAGLTQLLMERQGGIIRLRGLYFDSSVEAPMQSMELKVVR